MAAQKKFPLVMSAQKNPREMILLFLLCHRALATRRALHRAPKERSTIRLRLIAAHKARVLGT